MSIPILSDLIDALKWLIDFFVNKVPKPILFLIFVLFIATVGFLLSSMMHLVGIHCDSDKQAVKTDITDFFNNGRVMFLDKDVLSEQTYTLEELYPKLNFEDVVFYAHLNVSQKVYVRCTENDTDPTCKYYLIKGACYNCTYGDVCKSDFAFFCGEYVQICKGDAFAWTSGSISSSALCLTNYAKIPVHYAWNATTGVFNCVDTDYCGANATKQGSNQLDDMLDSMGAEPYYTTFNDKSIDRAVTVDCIGTSPTIKFFKFPLFDARIWLILSLIFVMFMFLSHLGQQGRIP